MSEKMVYVIGMGIINRQMKEKLCFVGKGNLPGGGKISFGLLRRLKVWIGERG